MTTLATVAWCFNRTPQTLLRWAEVREFSLAVLLAGGRYLFEDHFLRWLRWWDQRTHRLALTMAAHRLSLLDAFA